MPPIEPRRERREPALPVAHRRRLPIVTAVVVLAAFGAAIWYAYTMGKQAMVDGEIPLVAARDDPVRVAPEDPGGMQVRYRDKLVYEQLLSDAPPPVAGKETLLPPPEQPVDRPPPMPAAPEPSSESVPGQALPEGEGITATPLPTDPARPTDGMPPVEERTPALPPEETAPPKEAAPSETPPTVTEKPAEKPTAKPPEKQPARTGGYRVQIASLRSEAEARTAWERTRKANSDLLGRLEPKIERVDLGSRGIYHRLQAGPLSEKTLADMLCSQLKARNVGCIVVAP